MRPYTWDALGRATLRRQFPAIRSRDATAVVELVRRIGPVQSQAARSPFLTVSSRLPGATHASVTAAYEARDLVRSSTLRGTVHTSTVEQHEWCDACCRRSTRAWWQRGLGVHRAEVGQVQDAIEEFAAGAWRTPAELRTHLNDWVATHDPAALATTSGSGRHFATSHSALIRRPLPEGPGCPGWERQGTPGYRSAAEILGRDRSVLVADPQAALVELARHHVAWFGPSSIRDIAWWTGDRPVDVAAAVAALGEELVPRSGPDGDRYYDSAEPVTAGRADPGTRLLPEFDALLLGRDSKRRQRFVEDAHLPWYWNRANGMHSCVLLHRRRIRGSWRLDGKGGDRSLTVRMFPGEERVREDALTDQVGAVQAALAITVSDLRIVKADDT